MEFGKLAKSKRIVGAMIAAILLTVIYVPFQQATAFTVTIDLADDDDTISQSAAGENFEIVIDVEAGELISIDEITLILDNGNPRYYLQDSILLVTVLMAHWTW